MIRSDFHVHTAFSTDSHTPAKEQIEALIRKGITEICITDHEDIGYCVPPDMPESAVKEPFRLDPFTYYETMSRLALAYRDHARLSIGIELGLRTDYHHSIEDFADICPWDFIIGSTHVVNGADPYYSPFWEGKTVSQGLEAYYQVTLANIRRFDCFDVYGHLDYINRYIPGPDKTVNPLDYMDIIDEILRLLIQKGKGIECNTAGLKYGLPQPNPDTVILKRYRELGGEILTIGSDGHKPEHVAYDFDRLPSLLQDCGFSYYTVFHDRKPVMLAL